jgi:hypothetical protein
MLNIDVAAEKQEQKYRGNITLTREDIKSSADTHYSCKPFSIGITYESFISIPLYDVLV